MSLADNRSLDAKNSINYLPKKHYKHVMCFGTFDIFHPGHVYYLSEAEKLAPDMTIVIARDSRVERLKGKMPHDTEDVRLMNVANAFDKSGVILGDEEDIFVPIRQLHPDVLAFGYDQRVPEDKIRELFPNIEIVRIGGFETEKWKSSKLRRLQ
ncbi:MAG: synthetase [Patescibacteria group bacterium]|nr:synthetase [Patescibacteria group bacterium]